MLPSTTRGTTNEQTNGPQEADDVTRRRPLFSCAKLGTSHTGLAICDKLDHIVPPSRRSQRSGFELELEPQASTHFDLVGGRLTTPNASCQQKYHTKVSVAPQPPLQPDITLPPKHSHMKAVRRKCLGWLSLAITYLAMHPFAVKDEKH